MELEKFIQSEVMQTQKVKHDHCINQTPQERLPWADDGEGIGP